LGRQVIEKGQVLVADIPQGKSSMTLEPLPML
jgi:hypothetical protein